MKIIIEILLKDANMTNLDCFPKYFLNYQSLEIINPPTLVPVIVDLAIIDQNDNQQMLRSFKQAHVRQQTFLPLLPQDVGLAYVPTIVVEPQE